MKCNKCNKTWNLYDVKDKYDTCPHCKQKLCTKFEDFNSVSEGLYYCIKVGGKDILKNKAKMNSYISDLMGNSFPDRNLIKNAIDSDIGTILYDANEKGEQEKQAAVNQAVARMEREFSTNHEKAEEIVFYFTKALQWNITSSDVKSAKQRTSLKSDSSDRSADVSVSGNKNNYNPSGNAVIQESVQNTGKNATISDIPADMVRNTNASIADGANNSILLSGNAAINGNSPVNNTYPAEIQPANNVIVVEKKSKLPWILLIIILLLIAGAVAYWLLFMQPAKEPVMVADIPEPTTEATTEISTEDINDSEMLPVTEPETAVVTEPETEPETEPVTTTVAATETEPITTTAEPETAAYAVKNLSSLEYGDHTILRYDDVNKRIYFCDGTYQIKYYDIATGATEMFIDIYDEDKKDYENYVINNFDINPYTGKVYLDLVYNTHLNSAAYFYDVDADKILFQHDVSTNMTFLSSDEVVIENLKVSLSSGKTKSDGLCPVNVYQLHGEASAFLFNNEYYYFLSLNEESKYIGKSVQILTADGKCTEGAELTCEKGTKFFVDSDAVYYITPDHSIYQLDIDNAFSKDEDDGGLMSNSDNPDRLIIDGTQIENSGVAYLSSDIQKFVRIDDSCFIVFDGMDKAIKMIGDFPQ